MRRKNRQQSWILPTAADIITQRKPNSLPSKFFVFFILSQKGHFENINGLTFTKKWLFHSSQHSHWNDDDDDVLTFLSKRNPQH